jgi:nucleotide-binding universal stress UspA family protein
MPKRKSDKLLLPLDGSKRSIEMVRNLAQMKAFHHSKVVLLHVFNSVPECYWDIEKEPKSIKTVVHVKAWEREQRKIIEGKMNQARRILVQAGFDDEAVKVSIHNRRQGIARDIVKEAHNGYSAVMIRRRGAGAIRSMVLGSIATKLIASITFVPLLIMGKQRETGKVLIAMDSSDGAMRAVDFVAARLGGFDYDVRMVHVIRDEAGIAINRSNHESPQECRKIGIDLIKTVFSEARQRLVEGGFSTNQISEAIITGVYSRAAAIAKMAKEEGFSTVVVGRRGISQPRTFAIGRVSNKVIHMARKMCVWVIN